MFGTLGGDRVRMNSFVCRLWPLRLDWMAVRRSSFDHFRPPLVSWIERMGPLASLSVSFPFEAIPSASGEQSRLMRV